MTRAREASLDWVRRSLIHELRDGSPSVRTRAENLVAIAEHHHIPVEFLVRWIHAPAAGKQWTAAEWKRWCETFAPALEALVRKHLEDGQ